MVAWLGTQEKGATVQGIVHHTKWEICEGGATDKTIKGYIEDLSKARIIEYDHPYWKLTPYGEEWLSRHSI